MNLTKQPAYQKGKRPTSRSRKPNAEEKRHWARVATIPCIAGPSGCSGRITIHHTGTGAGGRKDHMKVLPLCYEHHIGKEGIEGKRMSKRAWQTKYETEEVLLTRLARRLKHRQEEEFYF